jgi:glycosyltransferase involved in cell wall biosynthesis
VAGDAALLVDPYDTEALVHAMTRLLREPELRARLSEAGVSQAKQFPWSRTAAETVAVYRAALSAARERGR